jgi:DNA mismatch endonuclease (patch repair protein)
MADIVDVATRSRMMSGIRAINTKPEVRVRQLLHRRGFRFRTHVSGLAGKPDIVLARFRALVFVHGCFWHGHGCALFKWPKSRPEFWAQKITGNRLNDEKAVASLRDAGWRIATVWECALKGTSRLAPDAIGNALAEWLRGDETEIEIPFRSAAQ